MRQSLLPPAVRVGASSAPVARCPRAPTTTPSPHSRRRARRRVSPVHAVHRAGRWQGDAHMDRPGRRQRLPDLPWARDARACSLSATVAHVTTQPNDPGCVWTDDGSSAPSAASPAHHQHGDDAGPVARLVGRPDPARVAGSRLLPQHPERQPADTPSRPSWGVTASSLPVVGRADHAGRPRCRPDQPRRRDHGPAGGQGHLLVPGAADRRRSPRPPTRSPRARASGCRPSLNLAAITMPPVTREIAQAAQTYGLIVNDQTGATVGFRAEDPTPLMRQGQPNPYKTTYFKTSTTGVYEDPNFLLASFPWADLQLVAPSQYSSPRGAPPMMSAVGRARHVLSVVGARPNFMKTVPVIAALTRRTDAVRHTLVHTGQHYDDAMSQIFLEELGVGAPDVMLSVGLREPRGADRAGHGADRAGPAGAPAGSGPRPGRRELDARRCPRGLQARHPRRPHRGRAALLRSHDARGDQSHPHRSDLRSAVHPLSGSA